MEPTLFAIFLMGCGHNLDVCRPVGALETRYETEAACQQAMVEAVEPVAGFPETVGACVALTAEQAEARPAFDWLFAADGRLIVEAETRPVELALN